MKLYKSIVVVAVCFLGLMGCGAQYVTGVFQNVQSFDGTTISYTTYNKGDIALIFIHGWSCDSRYWKDQIAYFNDGYQVVTIDLAGHGHSSAERDIYTMEAFANDVRAVVEKLELKKVILIGHSMGGAVIIEAAALMPDIVIGVIGVDTLHSFDNFYLPPQIEKFVQPFRDNFKERTREFVKTMFLDTADPDLVEWVAQDMASANQHMGISALENYLSGAFVKKLSQIDIPVRALNAELWPTKTEENKKRIPSFETTLMSDVGHFLMLEDPQRCNILLEAIVKNISTQE